MRNLADETYASLMQFYENSRMQAAHWFTYANFHSGNWEIDICVDDDYCAPFRWDSGLKTPRELNSMILRLSQ